MEERMREDAGAWRRSVAMTDEKLERVLREFERTVEKTQQSAEVLAGIRAFVKLVRES
jgi:exonuclease VII small subunit